MAGNLVEHADVRSTFFSQKGQKVNAAATFYVSTQEDSSRLEALLREASGTAGNKVLKESNDAAADDDE
jgi:hypothetical protein